MITRKVAPALAAGCTVVIKPSDLTPVSALALAYLGEQAGIPKGVINVVTGMPHSIGNELMANTTIRKISFTGSTRVGSLLMRGAADSAKRLSLELGDQFTTPIVLEDATIDMMLANEETFGPVAPLFRFKTEEGAIAIANGTPYGLAACVYTEGLKRSWRVAEALEFGMVGLNTGALSTEVAPFGGVKQSGLGREGAQAGIDEYLEMTSFHIGGLI